jgi:cytochrome c oxidase subunit 3
MFNFFKNNKIKKEIDKINNYKKNNKLANIYKYKSNVKHIKKKHRYHLVDKSFWPFFTSIFVLFFLVTVVCWLHGTIRDINKLLFSFFCLLFVVICWWRDVIREATFLGCHTKKVQKNLRTGMVLFIVSEIMFFFSFFWAFFHSSLNPSIQIYCVWPPMGIQPFNPFGVPLLNTVILLLSGVTITLTHHAILSNNKLLATKGFISTIFLGFLFTYYQFQEYKEAPFDITDSVYGSTFYITTGFHGLHVIIGTLFILVCYIRFILGHFSSKRHIGFEAAAWYWHFVDVVWLFLFISIYWWGGSETLTGQELLLIFEKMVDEKLQKK